MGLVVSFLAGVLLALWEGLDPLAGGLICAALWYLCTRFEMLEEIWQERRKAK